MAAPAPRDPRRGTSRPGANSRGSDRRYALPTRWRTRSRSRSPASRSADARPVGPRRDPQDPGPAWRRRRAARSRLEGDRAREEGILARAEAELRVGILDLERHHYRDAEARQDAHQPVE